VAYVACTGKMTNVYNIFVGKPEEQRPLGRLKRDGRIILKGMLGKWGGEVRT
jgi:hypothetical protein